MGWLKLDDKFDDHRKIVEVGYQAAWLDIRAMLYCARHESDGNLPRAMLSRIGSDFSATKRKQLVKALLEAGRWEETEEGYLVHDYLEYNPSHEEKENERDRARERMAKARTNKSRSSPDVHPEQRQNFPRSSDNPRSSPTVGNTPPTPPQGGLRASGENPRAIAKREALAALSVELANCDTCGDNNWDCSGCATRKRKLQEASA